MLIQIEKESGLPVYRQIVEQIVEKIQSGDLPAGTQLPGERELSVSTGISRGTIKRSYDELSARRIITRAHGSGTFVAQIANPETLHQKHRALELVDRMLEDLSQMKLSYREMESLIGAKIQWRRRYATNVRIAVVDCNLETLSLISEQLYQIPHVEVAEHVLSSLERNPQKLTYDYDLILTTNTHYLRVMELAPTVAEQVVKVALTTTQRTKYSLVHIPEEASVGIWCMSQEFANIVHRHLIRLNKQGLNLSFHLDCEAGSIDDFVQGKQILILPADYLTSGTAEETAVIGRFRRRGGQVMSFEYLIDNGSLIHVRHEVELLWKEKQERVR